MAKRIFKPQRGYFDEPALTRRRWLVAGWLVSLFVVACVTRNWSGENTLPRPAQSDAPTPKVAAAPAAESPASDKIDELRAASDAPVGRGREGGDAEFAADDGDHPPANEANANDPAAAESSWSDLRLASVGGLVPLPDAGASSEAVVAWCQELSARVDSVVRSQCMAGTFEDTGHRSVNGRPLVLSEVRSTSQPALGRVLLISATHGDEPSSIGTVFRWMHYMYESGTNYDWHVVPTVNPDGALHDPATRVNANGVDLNRNLPTTGWAQESRDYWRRVGFEKRRFPGEGPGSEPENAWLVDEIENYQPDVIISLHAPYGVLDYDGDFPAPRKLGTLNLHRLGVYPGSLGNFASRMQGIPVITVELDHASELPAPAETRHMWRDLNNWLDRYFRSVRQVRSESGDDAG